MADTSDAVLSFATDATPGSVLGASIAWQKINFVSHDIAPQADTVRSKVLRPDAATQEARRISGGFSGTIAMELARDVELETLMAAALRGTWVTNVLKAGVAKTNLVFEEQVPEGGTTYYQRYRGAVLGGFALEVSPDGLCDVRFPVSGLTMEDATTITTTATYVNAGTAAILAGVDFTALTMSGFATTLDVESISIDMTQNTRADRKLGSKDPRGIPYGKREATINVTAYFKDNEAFQKFKADPTTAAAFGFTAPGGTAGFDFAFARCRVGTYGKPIPGENNTIKVSLTLLATYDSTDLTDFKITRRT